MIAIIIAAVILCAMWLVFRRAPEQDELAAGVLRGNVSEGDR